jgi:flagellar motility protein MotE (MotC chaperone)
VPDRAGAAPGAARGAAVAAPNAARLSRAAAVGRAPAGTAPAGTAPTGAAKPDAGGAGRDRVRRRRALAPRLLPLTALAAALVLSVKVGTVWEHRAEVPTMFSVDMAVSVGAPAEAAGGSTAPGVQLAASEGGQGQAPAEGADGKVDPFALGKSQIELLQSLSERRKELDARERAIEQREGLLTAAEHRIESKIEELKAVKAEIEELIKKYDEQEEQQIAGLVKIYETMKPKDAARIFNELDMEVLLEVFERMKASKTAPVLADMDPIRAKEITTRIAERKKMPDIN